MILLLKIFWKKRTKNIRIYNIKKKFMWNNIKKKLMIKKNY